MSGLSSRPLRPLARTVSADRVLNADLGLKPCALSWFFRSRLSYSCPGAVLRSRRTVQVPPDHAPEGAAADQFNAPLGLLFGT